VSSDGSCVDVVVVNNNVAVRNDISRFHVADLEVSWVRCWCRKDKGDSNSCQSSELRKVWSHDELQTKTVQEKRLRSIELELEDE